MDSLADGGAGSPSRPSFPYWSPDGARRNFGDALAELLRGLFDLDRADPRDVHVLVGSVLAPRHLGDIAGMARRRGGRACFWGCGWRGEKVPPELLAQVTITAARGPRTIAELGLSPDLPIGDTALLLPLVYDRPRSAVRHRCTLMPHFRDPLRAQMLASPGRWGADNAVSPLVGNATELVAAIDAIRHSRFVLAGAMHAAVVAMAYGVPFAFFAEGFVDCRPKWFDLADAVGIPVIFARTSDAGRRVHERIAATLRPPPLRALLEAAPLPLRPGILGRIA
ncbi:MAG: polysaccharide pyruvyl transferase family protein [Alphaproteobacteria bacterium]